MRKAAITLAIILFSFNTYSQNDTIYLKKDSSSMKINSIWYGGYTNPHKQETYYKKLDTLYVLKENIIYNDTHIYSTPFEITKYIDGLENFNVTTTFFYTEESANEYKDNIHARIYQFDCVEIIEAWNISLNNVNQVYSLIISNGDKHIMKQTFIEEFKKVNEDEKVFYYKGSNDIKLWLNEDYTVAKIKLTNCALKKYCNENNEVFYKKDINRLLEDEILTLPIFEEW